MAVKLILVVLLVAVVSSGLAQQSSSSRRTGGGDREDRRLALRRFQNRNRSSSQDDTEVQDTRRQQPRRLANQDKIAERRRELLQRNGVARRRKVVRTQENEIEAVEPTKRPENIRIRVTPEPAKIEEPIVLVEKIGNSDNEIINSVLDRDEEAAKKPFIGTSEVRTISSPNSIRTGNEQIVRISFKKKTTTTTTPAPVEEEEEEQVTPLRRRFPANRGSFRKGPFGRRPSTEAPTTTTTPFPTTTKVFLLSQANDALKALLKTANEPVETTDLLTNTIEEEEERPLEPAEVESAVLEMEEDNGKVTVAPSTRSRGRGDRRRVRVNVRGRGRGQQRTSGDKQEAPRQSTPSRDRFRSFPARQNSGRSNLVNNDPRTRSRIVTPRTTTPEIQTIASTEETRFETRPTVSSIPTTTTPSRSLNSFKVFDDFEGFTFPAPIRAPPTTETAQVVTELPRSVPVQSQFTLQQSFVAAQPQPQVVQQPTPAPAQTFVPAPTLAPQRQPQPAFPQRQPQPAFIPQQQPVAQQPQRVAQQQPQRVQPFVAFNNQQFQTVTQAPAVQTQSRFQPATSAPSIPVPSQPQFLNNPNFNLLNPSNFQAFDAQFGGSVPSNPGSSQVSSNIFTQPGTSLLQGRDVVVNPFSAQSNSQQPSVFGTQNLFGQPASSNNFQQFRSG